MDRRIIFNKEDCGGVCITGEVILMDRNDVYTSFRVKTVVFHLLNVKKTVCNAVLCFLTAFLCSEYFCLFIWLYFFPFKENLSIYFLYQDRKNKKNFS